MFNHDSTPLKNCDNPTKDAAVQSIYDTYYKDDVATGYYDADYGKSEAADSADSLYLGDDVYDWDI